MMAGYQDAAHSVSGEVFVKNPEPEEGLLFMRAGVALLDPGLLACANH